MITFSWRAALAVLLVAPAAAQAADADLEAFYKGRQMRIVIGSSPGAGFDLYGRMVARHLPRFIPGKPQIIASNLPGAGSQRAVQSLRIEPKDGTYIVSFNPGQVMASVLTPEVVDNYKFTEAAFLGSLSAEIRVCYAWHETGVHSLDDLLKRKEPFVTGHTGLGAATYIDAAVVKNVLGAKLKQITGYPGMTEQRVAIERRELDGDCAPYNSISPEWISSGKARVLLRLGKTFDAETKKYPWVGERASLEQQRLIETVLFYHDMFRPFIVAREVPAERLKALREAFWQLVNDKEFQDEARKQGREVIGPMRGEEVERVVAEAYKTPKETIAKALEIIK